MHDERNAQDFQIQFTKLAQTGLQLMRRVTLQITQRAYTKLNTKSSGSIIDCQKLSWQHFMSSKQLLE